MGFSGGAETRYKKYPCKGPCKGPCKRKSYETICENVVSWYQTLVFSLPRKTIFWHPRPKTEFMTGPYRQPSNQPYKIRKIHKLLHFHFGPSKTFGVSSSKMWKGGPRWWAQQACPFAQWFNGCTLFLWCEELHRMCQRVQDNVNVSKLSRQFYFCCYWTWLLWLLCE